MRLNSNIFLFLFSICIFSCNSHSEYEISSIKEKKTSPTIADSNNQKEAILLIKTLPVTKHKEHKLKHGEHLSKLAEKEYGEAHYSTIIKTYNKINKITSFKKGDSIYIPNLNQLFNSNCEVSDIVDSILKARTLFIKHEPTLWKSNQVAITPETSRYNNLDISNLVSSDLIEAYLLVEYSIKSLENIIHDTLLPPTKMINQLKQVSDLLKSLSEGKCDENGYDINMVHQRLIHALNNGLFWINRKNYSNELF